MKQFHPFALCLLLVFSACTHEYHVSVNGNDQNSGSASKPLQTISAAALAAQPGDVITVHQGIYRERINPPRGGTSDRKRIVYRAAKGEEVWIKGSEVIKDWVPVEKPAVWKVVIPNSFFGNYNPYKDTILGDWFVPIGRIHHTGEVFLNGKSMFETDSLSKVYDPIRVVNPIMVTPKTDHVGSTYTWYCESDERQTTIYANFHEHDPNREMVEINVRESCFYPSEPGRNYITVSGFHLSQAATQWAAPTAEQPGLVGTHWSKGWIIENNEISDSKCVGITLGKDRKSGQNVWMKDPAKDGSVHYNEVVVKAIEQGWNKENIGSHIVRNNTIYNCGVAGICGSLGAAFSQITNNHIYDIWTKRLFTGPEKGGIKIHAAIDVIIKGNRIHNAHEGIWLDWMAQGTQVIGNLCYDNDKEDFYPEVDHGPYLVANNVFLSETAMWDMSEGGAYVHNLIAGKIYLNPQGRKTPYFKPHSTILAGVVDNPTGDDRFYNNIFVKNDSNSSTYHIPEEWGGLTGSGLKIYDHAPDPMQVDGNVYLHGALHFAGEKNYVERIDFNPAIQLVEKGDQVMLTMTLEDFSGNYKNQFITTALLGKVITPDCVYENPDGTPLKIDTDYFGHRRNETNPSAGPFENPGKGVISLKVW
jgi:hypothetical protein